MQHFVSHSIQYDLSMTEDMRTRFQLHVNLFLHRLTCDGNEPLDLSWDNLCQKWNDITVAFPEVHSSVTVRPDAVTHPSLYRRFFASHLRLVPLLRDLIVKPPRITAVVPPSSNLLGGKTVMTKHLLKGFIFDFP